MNACLASILQQPQSEPRPPAQSLNLNLDLERAIQSERTISEDSQTQSYRQAATDCSSRAAEEAQLAIFWTSNHLASPIIDRAAFQTHYDSLWRTEGPTRKPSALVEILLAISMQYSTAIKRHTSALRGAKSDSDANDATMSGMKFYRRCQALLVDQIEGPSITTLQCQYFSVVFLFNASFHNTAHSILAQAIRAGIILGLHLEPPRTLATAQKEFRKGLWWTVYAMEMKFAMELGRPLAVNISQVTCSLPSTDLLAIASDTSYTEPVTSSLIHNVLYIRLVLAYRAVYVTFYNKCADVLGSNGQESLYKDPEALEECAKFLRSRMEYLGTWLNDVPQQLKPKRMNSGEPYSTDGTPLDIDVSAPLGSMWLPTFLELRFHHVCMCLYRPFISFSKVNGTATPITEKNARGCVEHAITQTNIIDQATSTTDVLNGMYIVAHWQWIASLSLLGYILAYPDSDTTPVARRTVDIAIINLDRYRASFTLAANGAKVIRELCSKIDKIPNRTQSAMATMSLYSRPGDLQADSVRQPDPQLAFPATPNLNFPLSTTMVPELEEFSMPFTPMLNDFEMYDSCYNGNGNLPMWDLTPNMETDMFMPWLARVSEVPDQTLPAQSADLFNDPSLDYSGTV